MDRRTEERLDAEGLPVKVWGLSSGGSPFVLNCIAREVSYRGARLDGLSCQLAAGEVIAVQYGSQKGRFRVVWVADPSSQCAGQLGIRSVDDNCIWEGELAGFAQESTSPDSDPLAAARRDRRQYPRFRCQGDVQLHRLDSGRHVWAKLADLSLGGCYVDTSAPDPVGTLLGLELLIQEMKILAAGVVRTSVPALGMGIQFTSFEGDSRERLKLIVASLGPPKLAGRSQPGAASQPVAGLQSLLAALRDHFEGNNVMTAGEFEKIVQAILKRKPPPEPAQAETSRTA